MIKDAQIRGSFGFCLRRHGGRILAGQAGYATFWMLNAAGFCSQAASTADWGRPRVPLQAAGR